MSKASDQLAARAARTASRAVQASAVEPVVVAVAPRAQPVRITVDLAPMAHRDLLDVCRETAERLQLPKVPAASLVRALLVQLEQDPSLVERLLPALRTDVEENRRRK